VRIRCYECIRLCGASAWPCKVSWQVARLLEALLLFTSDSDPGCFCVTVLDHAASCEASWLVQCGAMVMTSPSAG